MASPSDQAAARSDGSAFACIPRYLVDEYVELTKTAPEDLPSLGEAMDHGRKIEEAAKAIADAAADDIL